LGKKNKYKIKSRFWICTEEGTFLGEGRVALLSEIEKFGSISKAAKAMEMSYKKAWELVNSMNSQSDEPLVKRTIGGTGGGGTVLTDAGKKAIKVYKEIDKRCKNSLDNELEFLNS